MFIGTGGGVRKVQAGNGRITMALTTTTGNVVIEQADGVGGWFPVVYDGIAVVLNSNFTMVSVYAPCELRITATGTGVYLVG